MNNNLIRGRARELDVPLWSVADALGVSEATMTRKLRKELPEEEQQHILAIIEELAATNAEKDKGGDNNVRV